MKRIISDAFLLVVSSLAISFPALAQESDSVTVEQIKALLSTSSLSCKTSVSSNRFETEERAVKMSDRYVFLALETGGAKISSYAAGDKIRVRVTAEVGLSSSGYRMGPFSATREDIFTITQNLSEIVTASSSESSQNAVNNDFIQNRVNTNCK